jgi:hypothetical protein
MLKTAAFRTLLVLVCLVAGVTGCRSGKTADAQAIAANAPPPPPRDREAEEKAWYTTPVSSYTSD